MPKAIFQDIYRALKDEIERGDYAYQSLLPSESKLTQRFACSRSSVRRALDQLAGDGYVQPLQGKGVRVIHNTRTESSRGLGDLETFKEMTARLGYEGRTEVPLFEEITVDERLAKMTGFKVGSKLVRIMRQRLVNRLRVSTDDSYYLASSVPGLTPEIARNSVYEYLENDLGFQIVTSKRTLTVEAATESDQKYIDLDGYNAIGVMRCHAYDTDGILVEYTESRQRPGFYETYVTCIRHKPRLD